MKTPIFTEEQLRHYEKNPRRDMTDLESSLAATLLAEREERAKESKKLQAVVTTVTDELDNTYVKPDRTAFPS
jgi:hypothetical protein